MGIILKEENKIIITISGEPKVGKTHFALSCPEPIEVFDFDGGVTDLLSKFDKDIRLHQFIVDVWGKEPVSPLWEGFLEAYKEALVGDAKTIILDTATQLWEVVRLAHLERVQKESPKERVRLQPVEYAVPNSIMRSVISAPKANEKNLVLTHYIKEVWDNEGRKTGLFEPDCFKHTEGLADLVLLFNSKKLKPTGEETVVTVARCRKDRDLVGQKLTNPDWGTISNILMLEE